MKIDVFDVTLNYVERVEFQHESINKEYSEPFSVINCQITHKFNDFDFYIGGENLLEYKQDNPILNYENPSSDSFDASNLGSSKWKKNLFWFKI